MAYLQDKLIAQNYEMIVQAKVNNLKLEKLKKLDILLRDGTCSCEISVSILKHEIKYCTICKKESDRLFVVHKTKT